LNVLLGRERGKTKEIGCENIVVEAFGIFTERFEAYVFKL